MCELNLSACFICTCESWFWLSSAFHNEIKKLDWIFTVQNTFMRLIKEVKVRKISCLVWHFWISCAPCHKKRCIHEYWIYIESFHMILKDFPYILSSCTKMIFHALLADTNWPRSCHSQLTVDSSQRQANKTLLYLEKIHFVKQDCDFLIKQAFKSSRCTYLKLCPPIRAG